MMLPPIAFGRTGRLVQSYDVLANEARTIMTAFINHVEHLEIILAAFFSQRLISADRSRRAVNPRRNSVTLAGRQGRRSAPQCACWRRSSRTTYRCWLRAMPPLSRHKE